MQTMTTLETLYMGLNIVTKIEDSLLRVLYLREVWGMEQRDIGKCENITQPQVSTKLKKAKEKYSQNDIDNLKTMDFSEAEIKYIQSMPREVIKDAPLIAFVNNVLGLKVSHPFYAAFTFNEGIRIAALNSIGIRQKKLMELFNRKQPAISVAISRNINRALEIERPLRYDLNSSVFMIEHVTEKQKPKFYLAGGQ